MKLKLKVILIAPSLLLLASCISTAENMIDGIAGAAGNVGSKALYNVDEKECSDPALLAKKAVGLQFHKDKSLLLAQDRCNSKFSVDVSEAAFSENYNFYLRQACFTQSDGNVKSTYCTEAIERLRAGR